MFCTGENSDKTSKTDYKLIYVINIHIINNCKGSYSCNPEPGC